nr:IS66 family transposase zinc-finger binding domain-containing protein [Legionella quateirensis]
MIEHDIADEEKLCACGCMKQRIGEEVTEQLEYVPAKLSVIAHVRLFLAVAYKSLIRSANSVHD